MTSTKKPASLRDKEEKEPKAVTKKDPTAIHPHGVINAQRAKAGWSEKEIIAGKRDETKAKVKEVMEGKFGKDYDRPKATALSSSAAKGSKPASAKVPDDAHLKIEVLSKANPHKPGSNRALAFDHAVKSKTVGAYLNGGAHCKHKYLAFWAKCKLIKLT